MKRFFGRILSVLLCTVLALGVIPAAQAADGDEIRAAKKVISIVCDDSGSMSGDRWTYANYATQALIAQLNAQDELYITFMSAPGNAVKINTANLPGEVKTMERRDCPGNTPYRAVETAYNQIKNVQATDGNTQYWLIVTTDGSIGGIPTKNGMDGTLQSVLDKYKGETMSNGTKLNVGYLAMADQYACRSDTSNNLYTFTATDPKAISEALADVSNLISSRLKASPVTQVDGKTVSFESKLPIYSISVLLNQSSAKVVSASTAESALDIDRNIELRKDQLFGNVAVATAPTVQGKSQVIPAGTYTITFSEDVDLNNLLVQYEPAIGVKMLVSRGGKEVADFSALQPDDNVSVELIPVIPGTDTPIDPATLPAGIRWGIEYCVDGQEKNRANSAQMANATILPGDNVIRGTMQLPGFSEVVFEKRFNVIEIIYGLTVNQPDDASYPRKNPAKSINADNAVILTVTNNGVPMTKEEIQTYRVALKTDLIEVSDGEKWPWFLRGWSKAGVKYEMNDDGTFTLIPKPGLKPAFMIRAGQYTVTVSINNAPTVQTVATFELVPSASDFIDLLWVFVILLAIWWVIAIWRKPKFPFANVEIRLYNVYNVKHVGEQYIDTLELHPFKGKNILAPCLAPCYVEEDNSGVVLAALEDETVWVRGDSITKNESIEAYGRFAEDPMEDMGSILDRLTPVQKGGAGKGESRRTISDFNLSPKKPLYLLCGNTVYCLKLTN